MEQSSTPQQLSSSIDINTADDSTFTTLLNNNNINNNNTEEDHQPLELPKEDKNTDNHNSDDDNMLQQHEQQTEEENPQLPTTINQNSSSVTNNKNHSSASIIPIAISQVDRIIKSAARHPTNNNIQMTCSKEAKIAIHKAANIFILLMAASVEDNRIRDIEGAKTVTQRKMAMRRLASGQISNIREIKGAVESAGFGHLLAAIVEKKRGRS